MNGLNDLVDSVRRHRSFIIHAQCTGCDMYEIYDLLFDSVDKMAICKQESEFPCNMCFNANVDNFRMDDYTRDNKEGEEINYDYEQVHRFITVNRCTPAVIFVEFKKELNINSTIKCFAYLKYKLEIQILIGPYTLEPCKDKYSICFFLMTRDKQKQEYKDMNVFNFYSIQCILEWINEKQKNDRFLMFNNSLKSFVKTLKKGLVDYIEEHEKQNE